MLLYNGPLRDPNNNEYVENDYIAVELLNGKPRVTVDYGTGSVSLMLAKTEMVSDGDWHRIDIVLENKVLT